VNPKTVELVRQNFPTKVYEPNELILASGKKNDTGYLVLSGVVKTVAFDKKGTERRLIAAHSGDIIPTI
jgi:CRP-like cAMP-binding protein